MTRQILRTYKDIGASLPKATDRFIADYSALKDDLLSVEESIALLLETIEGFKPLSGAQPPEGNVASNASLTYFDTTNSPTDVTMYFNETEGADTGWVVVT